MILMLYHLDMNLIGRDTDYALRALLFITRNGIKNINVRYLSQKLNLPYYFLRRIFQKLAKEKLFISYRGRGGGFKVNVLLKRITVLEVAEIFQGKISFVNCFLRGKICPQIRTCQLRFRLKQIEKDIIGVLGKETIGSLLKSGGKNG